MEKFIDREQELKTLQKEYERKESSFVVIYGRRRVGKTSLINHFCRDRDNIYFLATEESETENREAFKRLTGEHLNNTLLANARIDRWEDIFEAIANRSGKDKRLILVLDEFQYLGKANKSFPSVLMGIWDQLLKDSNIMLILCGSLINMMTSQVLSYDSPLYGRRTAQIKLGQIPFDHYHAFYPKMPFPDLLERYAVTGGVPKYVELFADDADIYAAIRTNILSKNSFLYAEPEFLLQKEVVEIGSYFSILKTIAAGNHKLGKIATALEVPQTKLTPYLKTLMDLDLVGREVPVTEENPAKSKQGLYFIKDNFISFWFRFVYPYKSLLESDQEEYVMNRIRQNFIDNHVSYVYEDVCRGQIWQLLDRGISITRSGRWWDGSTEIDIVAYDSAGEDIVFGECKYSKNPKGMDVLTALREKTSSVKWNSDSRKETFCIFSKSGFSDALTEYAKEHEQVVLIQEML
jgi:hypothetical protein